MSSARDYSVIAAPRSHDPWAFRYSASDTIGIILNPSKPPSPILSVSGQQWHKEEREAASANSGTHVGCAQVTCTDSCEYT